MQAMGQLTESSRTGQGCQGRGQVRSRTWPTCARHGVCVCVYACVLLCAWVQRCHAHGRPIPLTDLFQRSTAGRVHRQVCAAPRQQTHDTVPLCTESHSIRDGRRTIRRSSVDVSILFHASTPYAPNACTQKSSFQSKHHQCKVRQPRNAAATSSAGKPRKDIHAQSTNPSNHAQGAHRVQQCC